MSGIGRPSSGTKWGHPAKTPSKILSGNLLKNGVHTERSGGVQFSPYTWISAVSASRAKLGAPVSAGEEGARIWDAMAKHTGSPLPGTPGRGVRGEGPVSAKNQIIWQIRATLRGAMSRDTCHASDRRHGRVTSTHITICEAGGGCSKGTGLF